MNLDPPSITPEHVFSISYESGAWYNRDLAGAGTLTIRGDSYTFRGRQRKAVVNGGATELSLRADQIWNVTVLGPAVEFGTRAGKSGEKGQPFVFFCESEIDATTIGSLLPATKDPEFAQGEAFYAKLRAMPSATGAGSVTNVLVTLNVIAFMIMGLLGAGWLEAASRRPYVLYSAINGSVFASGEWWRFGTSMFVHYGLMHLAFNMMALYQVGQLVERLYGRTLFTVVYLGSGLLGTAASLAMSPDNVWRAGASGAVFGVYGSVIGYLLRQKQGVPGAVLKPMIKSTLLFALYNLIFGAIVPHIDNMAHIGGFVGGILLGWVAALPLDRDVRRRATWSRFMQAVAVLVVVFGPAAWLAASRR